MILICFFPSHVCSCDSVRRVDRLLVWDLQLWNKVHDKLVSSLLAWVTPGIYTFAYQNCGDIESTRTFANTGVFRRFPASAHGYFSSGAQTYAFSFQLWVWRNLQSSLSAMHICQVSENGGKWGLRGVPHCSEEIILFTHQSPPSPKEGEDVSVLFSEWKQNP